MLQLSHDKSIIDVYKKSETILRIISFAVDSIFIPFAPLC